MEVRFGIVVNADFHFRLGDEAREAGVRGFDSRTKPSFYASKRRRNFLGEMIIIRMSVNLLAGSLQNLSDASS